MKYLLIIVLFLFPQVLFAEVQDPEKKEFMALVKTRTAMFEEYTLSLNKKSGLFGSRTKNDIRDSQDKLMEIVNIDNKIMNMLNRRLGFRNFEKQNMTDDMLAIQKKLINLNIVNDTLTQKLSVCEEENKEIKNKMTKYKLMFFLIVLAISTWVILKARKYFRN